MSENEKNLYYLEELSDYKVASDYYDVRGWDVMDAENRTIGKVTNLLVNLQEERVVYLDVEVNPTLIEFGYKTYQVPASDGVHGFLNKDGEEHLIVPIGMISLDTEEKTVLTDQIDYNTFAKAKRFKSGTSINRDREFYFFHHFVRDDKTDVATMDEDFYKRKEFDNNLKRL